MDPPVQSVRIPTLVPGLNEPARSLAETQLQIQFSILGGLDTAALGILGVDVALAAVTVAAKDILERLWWMPLIALAVSGFACFVALVSSGDRLGPTVKSVLDQAGVAGATEDDLNRFVAKELGDAIEVNDPHIQRESAIIGFAVFVLVLALVLGVVSAVWVS
jgi:hypothetical protein